MPKGFAGLGILAVVLIVLTIVAGVAWTIGIVFLPLPPHQVPQGLPPTTVPTTALVTGSVIVYHMDIDEVTIQLIAQSPKSNVTEMLIWTDKKPRDQANWKPFQTLTKIPLSEVNDKIFAVFRDEQGNISDVYSDTLFSPFGPANAP